MPNKKSILFDLDGTVVDTHELIFQCYDRTMQEQFGCRGSRKILEQCTGKHLNDIFRATLRHFEIPFTDALLADAVIAYRNFLRENEAAVSTFPGIKSCLIEFARRGWLLGIVTTKGSEAAHRHLNSQGLAELFQVVIAAEDCVNHKPHPEPFSRSLTSLNAKPAHAIGVGDSEHDINSARAAGMTTIAACWGTLSRDRLLSAKPDHVAEHPGELLDIVAQCRLFQ